MRTKDTPAHQQAPRFPETLGRIPLPDGVRLQLSVSPRLSWCADHFPGRPVVPGVARIAWTIAYAREHFGQQRDPLRIERVKFLHPVPFDTPLALELLGSAERVDWRLLAGETLLGSGRLLF